MHQGAEIIGTLLVFNSLMNLTKRTTYSNEINGKKLYL